MNTSLKLQTLVLFFLSILSISVFAQPMSINGKKGNDNTGDNLMPMSINSPKANALFGFIQAGNQSAQITLKVGKNTIQFPGIATKYTAEISENFQLYTLADMLRDDLKADITPVPAPENYTDPGTAKFFALSIPTSNGTVIKGILAIGITGDNPFVRVPSPLPAWF
ncbi:MAG: hypothetical protein IPM47_01790 [Sphingobacteriales bacterium]|nr:MAG: hypothetical protein IPM47_01790 [Sphingobacteriales bacterium]